MGAADTAHYVSFRYLLRRRKSWLCILLGIWAFGFLVFTLLLRSNDGTEKDNMSDKIKRVKISNLGTLPTADDGENSIYIPKQTEMLIHKYCNNPMLRGKKVEANKRANILSLLHHTNNGGDEGKSPPGYKLVSVVLVTRHGDRASLRHVPQLHKVECGVDVAYLLAHGIRNKVESEMVELLSSYMSSVELDEVEPGRERGGLFSQIPAVPSDTRCHPEQMTNIGVLQQLINGRRLHHIYKNDFNLSSTRVTVISTKYPRTYQSARAFLHTFLPNDNHSVVVEWQAASNTRLCKDACTCHALGHYQKQVESENRMRLVKHPSFVKMVSDISEIVLNTSHTGHVSHGSPLVMFDILMSFACHGAALPCQNGKCVLQHQLDKLTSFLNMNERQRIHSPSFVHYSLLTIWPLLNSISKSFKSATLESPKITLYSAHDVTLSPLTISLGFHDDFIPPYASLVSLELYTADDGSKYLRVIYNGKDMTRRLRFCAKSVNNDNLCPLNVFDDFINNDIFVQFNASSYQRACKFFEL